MQQALVPLQAPCCIGIAKCELVSLTPAMP